MEKELPKRKDLRLKQYNYSSKGAYFITICTKDRQRILSNIIKPVGVGALDDPTISQIQLTEIGKVIEKYLLSSENIPGVKIDRYVIMPNHIHIIIFFNPSEYAQLNNGMLGTPNTNGSLGMLIANGSSKAPTPTNEMLPHVVSTFKRFCNKEIGSNIFQRGYMEHIIRNRHDYEEHLRYIHENPMRWYYDELYAEE